MKRIGVLVLLLALAVPRAFGMGEDQLYTGDASTTPPGRVKVRFFYNTIFDAGIKVSGTSLTFGLRDNVDARSPRSPSRRSRRSECSSRRSTCRSARSASRYPPEAGAST